MACCAGYWYYQSVKERFFQLYDVSQREYAKQNFLSYLETIRKIASDDIIPRFIPELKKRVIQSLDVGCITNKLRRARTAVPNSEVYLDPVNRNVFFTFPHF